MTLSGVTAARLLLVSLAAAVAVFCVVQDRVVAAGVGRYVALKRAAIAGRAPDVTVDEVMTPAIRESIQQGVLWSSAVLASGLTLALIRHGRAGPFGPAAR